MKSTTNTSIDKLNKLALLGTTALIAGFGVIPTAYAQDSSTVADTVEDDEIVTTGIRQSLKEARDLKRNADTAVDSITASDVGALPDLSVAEALARIPGVVAQRFDITSGNGGDFPSPEGGGNLIRGLTLVNSQFNGRESFSANGGRALDFGTVPPELIGAVDVFKNTTADMLEGGIGGTINLRTLEPFDKEGLVAVINVDGTYTDLRDEWSPEYSVLLGNRWDTGAGGEVGLLGSFASSELKSELHGFQIGQVIPFATDTGTIALPGGVQLRTNEVDRKRDSYYIAGQYQNASGDFKLTAKYSRIENDTDSDERTLEFFGDGEMWASYDVTGLTTTPFTSAGLAQCNGSNDPTPANPTCEVTQPVSGLYESGLISNSLRDWTGSRGANFSNLGIHQQDESMTDDLSLNMKWRPSDQLYVTVDAHRTTAEFTTERLWNGSRFFSDFELDANLDNPGLRLVTDPENNPNRRPGGLPPVSGDLSNPDSAFLLFAADEFRDNDGDMYAIRGDVEYEFDNDGWFDAVKFGARYADREQDNRQAGLNWAAVAAPWAGGYLPFSELATPASEAVSFSDFFRGGVVTGDNTDVVFAGRELLQDYDGFVAAMASDPNVPNSTSQFGTPQYGDWAPLRNDGVVDYSRGQTGNVREKTLNLYTRLDFGQEFDSGMSIDGNIGLRYVRTVNSSAGTLAYNEISDNPSTRTNDNGTPDDTSDDFSEDIPNSRPSFFSPETVEFFNQVDEALFAEGTDERWLPSFNAKWNLSDQSLVRFGVSKVISRPNISDLRVDRNFNTQAQFIRDPDLAEGEEGAPLDIRFLQTFQGGGNPALKPVESVNWDLSYERYWGDNNSFSFAVFAKSIENNIVDASTTEGTLTLDGNSVPIIYTGKLNQDDAKVQGLEIAYQQFFDEWPGLLGNLGIQANYTYIAATANPPPGAVDADGDGAPDSFERIYRYGVDNFLGLSEDAVNLIGIYQDEKLEMRLAYNWRSEYLGSYRDFVTGNPIFQQPTGYLDGSIKYDINDNFQVRAQIANITDEKANAEQQIDAAGQRFGRTSFIGDRRIKIGARYQF